MAEQSWIIGAAPECDVVVDEPTVSGRHCRLTRTSEGYRIEDLGSTNGTFVGGRRINGAQTVRTGQEVRLGPEARLPWEAVAAETADRRVIQIGRMPDNDVVIDDPRVSGRHARLTVDGEEMRIEDLGSTNGLAVGSPENRVTTAPVKRHDTVYLGSLAVPVAQLLRGQPRPQTKVRGFPPASGTTGERPGFLEAAGLRRMLSASPGRASAVVGVLAVFLLVGAVAFFLRGGSDRESDKGEATGSRRAGASRDGTDAGRAGSGSPKPVDPAEAVYGVLVQDSRSGEFLNLGTACAVGTHRLLTSASVVHQLKQDEFRSEFRIAKVRCQALDRDFVIRNATAHQSFEAHRADEVEAAAEIQALVDELNAAADSSSQAALSEEELKRKAARLKELASKRFLIVEKEIFFDVGVLEVDGRLPVSLPLGDHAEPPSVGAETRLFGMPPPHPFQADDETEEDPGPVELKVLEGSVSEIFQPGGAAARMKRLTVSAPTDHTRLDWRGGPVLDSAGRIVGVYSRPTPNGDDHAKPPTGESFDAAWIGRLRDFAPTLWQSPSPASTGGNRQR